MDLEKEKQVTRLISLVTEAQPRINSLHVAYDLKRETDKVFEERIKNEKKLLNYEILIFLQGKINESSPEDLKKISGIYFEDNGDSYELLPFIVEKSFHLGLDNKGQIYAQAGSGLTPPIKMEDIRRRLIAQSFDEVKSLLQRISGYLQGIAWLDFNEIEDNTDEFVIGYTIAGLIHKNSLALS